MSRRTWLVVGVLLATVTLVVVIVAVTSTSTSPSSNAPGTSSAAPAPAAASVTVPGGSQVVVAMGHLDDPSNTFYELFDRSPDSTSWELATPPGVADNGGLIVGSAPAGAQTAGFLPSAYLTFSVLARRSATADPWTPGSVPGTLAAEPDGLATGTGGQVAAVLDRPVPEVVTAGAGLTTWRRLTTVAGLARVPSRCAVDGVTSVAISSSGTPIVGTGCTGSSTAGLFADAPSGGWTPLGPLTVPGAPSATTVLRLQAGTAGLTALVEGSRGAATTLVAVWGAGGTGLSGSAPLAVPAGWSVLGTSVGGGRGRGVSVLLGSTVGPQRRVEAVDGPAAGSAGGTVAAWAVLPTPPSGTTAVAGIGAETDAFVPVGNRLTVWSITPSADGWTRASQQTVSLQYGSSS